MKVLVLGATGFLGGAIARACVARGDDVRSLVRRPGADAVGEPFVGTIGDPASIARAAEGVDAVVHAAGIVSSRAAARALRWTHVAGTENVINACKHARVTRLVHVGCADASLVNADRVHWDERRALAQTPIGERARTLQLAEELALAADLEVVALRPAWVWGPGDTSRLPWLCREAIEQRGIQLVGDGRTFLATVYIDHVAAAALRALTSAEAVGHTFHLADSEYLHAREFFGALSRALELPPPRSGLPLWAAVPLAKLRSGRGPSVEELLQRGRSTLLDVNEATGKLAFASTVTLEQGMAALTAWARTQGGAKALADLARPPPNADAVDDQVRAAGGD